MRIHGPALAAMAAVFAVACSTSSPSTAPATKQPGAKTDDVYKQEVTQAMHASLAKEIDLLVLAAEDLKATAPTPTQGGWQITQDPAALARMRATWKRARTAYEHIEGAVQPLFPDIDAAIDLRYDDFLAAIKEPDRANGDPNPFDDKIVTGMHAIERIIYADSIPVYVVDFEKTLEGYRPARMPATEEEASDFQNGLAEKLILDTRSLRDQWQPQRIDLAGAFGGLVALMNEQREKVNKASTNEEESRYAQRTMQDIKDNLDGTRAVYLLFQPWLLTKPDGAATDKAILDAMQRLADAYAKTPGDAIPPVPATWSSENPSPADLATPFGQLYTAVRDAADPKKDTSVVSQMNRAARVLGFPEFQKN